MTKFNNSTKFCSYVLFSHYDLLIYPMFLEYITSESHKLAFQSSTELILLFQLVRINFDKILYKEENDILLWLLELNILSF